MSDGTNISDSELDILIFIGSKKIPIVYLRSLAADNGALSFRPKFADSVLMNVRSLIDILLITISFCI